MPVLRTGSSIERLAPQGEPGRAGLRPTTKGVEKPLDPEVRGTVLEPAEVAGDGNQDKVKASEALSKETESNRSALPKSQAPSPDPTTRRGFVALLSRRDLVM